MCRLLGYWTGTPQTVAQMLGESWSAFLDLSKKHPDGWGLAWIDPEGMLHSAKATEPAYASTSLHALVHERPAYAAILHFRWATPGLPVTLNNTHPFIWAEQQFAFCHNGAITPISRLYQALEEGGIVLEGATDSEGYFRLWIDGVRSGAAPAEALKGVVQRIRELAMEYTSLNAMWLHPVQSYVFTEYESTAPLALEDPNYYTLYMDRRQDAVLIASSQWPMPSHWRPVPNHTLVSITRGGTERPRVHVETLG
jgi:predicted glutamine amidotransferase